MDREKLGVTDFRIGDSLLVEVETSDFIDDIIAILSTD